MKKIIILIPVYNDWISLEKLLIDINDNIESIQNISVDCMIINDASNINQPKIKKPKTFNNLKVFNMNENKGHARCNAFGIRYILENENFDHVILMDGDGEDRPVELQSLIKMILKYPGESVVAKRIKRSEGPFFQLLYNLHKIITKIFTGENINFGNYSCLTKNDIRLLSSKESLWSSFSGTVKKNLKNYREINSVRGSRYFGPSKMSLIKLLIHSFSIIAVFKYKVLLRSIFFILVLLILAKYFGLFIIIIQILIIAFNLTIFVVSLRENRKDFLNCQSNLKNIEIITN